MWVLFSRQLNWISNKIRWFHDAIFFYYRFIVGWLFSRCIKFTWKSNRQILNCSCHKYIDNNSVLHQYWKTFSKLAIAGSESHSNHVLVVSFSNEDATMKRSELRIVRLFHRRKSFWQAKCTLTIFVFSM